jgi:hypothetical protein
MRKTDYQKRDYSEKRDKDHWEQKKCDKTAKRHGGTESDTEKSWKQPTAPTPDPRAGRT